MKPLYKYNKRKKKKPLPSSPTILLIRDSSLAGATVRRTLPPRQGAYDCTFLKDP